MENYLEYSIIAIAKDTSEKFKICHYCLGKLIYNRHRSGISFAKIRKLAKALPKDKRVCDKHQYLIAKVDIIASEI